MPRALLRIFFLTIYAAFATACTARTPDPSPSPLFTSSPLPLFTPTPLHSVPSPSLRSPDPASLLRVLNYGISLERGAWEQFDYGNFTGDFLTSPEARALFDFVQADFDRYYANGIPQAGEMLTNESLDPNIWFPPRAVWTSIQAGVVDLFRARGTPLQTSEAIILDSFTLTPNTIELDGDPDPEWLIEVASTKYNLRGWFPVNEEDGQYTLLPNDLQHENQARAQGVTTQITPDLNGDGLSDFLLYFDGQPLGSQFGYLQVYGGVSVRFSLDILQIKPGESFEITESELRITIPRTLNFECAWIQTNVYRWQGAERHHTFLSGTPPETPFCHAARALSPFPNITPTERATLLETALANMSPESIPSADYMALLNIHLAMAYTSQGLEQQALARMTDLPDWAGNLWKAENENFPAFCNALYAEGGRGTLDTTGLARYFTPFTMIQAYGQITLDPGALVCPLSDWAQYRLETLTPPIARVPGEFWPELGTALSDATPYQLDDDPEEEWIGWLDWKVPQFLLLDPMDETWRIVQLAWKPNSLAQFQSHVTDFDENGVLDILLLATFDASVPVSAYPKCWAQGAMQVSDLIMVSWSGREEMMGARTTLCGEPPALENLSAVQLQEWFTEVVPSPPTLDADPRGFYRRLEEQEALILSGMNLLEARQVTAEILSGVSTTHSASETVIPRILFGIGLSYEIEGNAASALIAYQDLIAQWPDSPWAWLAEARISNY